jgi:hypothetical protein
MFKRAGLAALLIGVPVGVTGCASADHSWRGEFGARLEGASARDRRNARDDWPRHDRTRARALDYPEPIVDHDDAVAEFRARRES